MHRRASFFTNYACRFHLLPGPLEMSLKKTRGPGNEDESTRWHFIRKCKNVYFEFQTSTFHWGGSVVGFHHKGHNFECELQTGTVL